MSKVTPRDCAFHYFIGAILVGGAVISAAIASPKLISLALMSAAGGMNIGVAFEYARLRATPANPPDREGATPDSEASEP